VEHILFLDCARF